MPKYSSNAFFVPTFLERVKLGEVDNFFSVDKFGAISGLGTTLTPVASGGAYATPTAATALEIVSDSANDESVSGSGARTVTIHGLDASFALQSETVSLNGITAVDLANTYTRVFRMYVATSGTYATSAGSSHNSTITLREDGGGATWAQITREGTFGLGQSLIAAYTVPAGHTAWMSEHHFTVESTKIASFFMFVREGADTVSAPYSPMRVQEITRTVDGSFDDDSELHRGPFTGPCDIGFLAAMSTGTGNVTVDFSLLVRDDSL